MTFAVYQKAVDEGRVLYIVGAINLERVAEYRKALGELRKSHQDAEILIVLTTQGGSAYQGEILHNELRAAAASGKAWLLTMGYVESIGVFLLTAFPKKKRIAFPSTTFYSHRFSVDGNHKVCGGHDEVRYGRKELVAQDVQSERAEKAWIKKLADDLGITENAVEDLMEDPKYLTTEEAVTWGFVSSIITD